MSETQAEPHVNGTAPDPPRDEPCENCATTFEKLLGILVIGFAAFIVVMGIDMITGGRISGIIREQATP